MNVREEKNALRKSMLEKRNGIDLEFKKNYDNTVCAQLKSIILENNFKVVHAYIPMANEIDIAPLLKQLLALKITVVCPKTCPARVLENRVLHSLNELETGIKGTKHPAAATIYHGQYDLVIVPGLAFDARKFRLGYGGGYYDNFLNSQSSALKVGIFYPFQKVPQVPTESHDVCLNEIICTDLN